MIFKKSRALLTLCVSWLFLRETTLERRQPYVKIINIPVDSVADPVGAGKRRFDPVDSVKATHRGFI